MINDIFFSGYNFINTTVYGLIISLLVFIVIKLIKNKKIKIKDDSISFAFFIALLCASIRVLGDLNKLPNFIFLKSPFIYFNVAILGFITYIVAQKSKFNKYKNHFLLVLSLIILVSGYELKNIQGILLIITINIIIYIILKLLPFKLLKNDYNLHALYAHLFDSTATFISIDFFNYTEQHPVPLFFINLFNTSIVMYLLKITIIIPILILIKNEKEDVKKIILLTIIYLGFLTGIRDLLRLGSLA